MKTEEFLTIIKPLGKKTALFLNRTLPWTALTVFLAFIVSPIIIAALNTLKSPPEFFAFPAYLFPQKPSFSNLIGENSFTLIRAAFNSLIIALITAVIDSAVCAGASYVLVRHKSKLINVLNLIIRISLVFTITGFAALKSDLTAWLGLYNTYAGMILPFTASSFSVIIISQYMKKVPESLYDTATIEGMDHFKVFWHIFLPMSKPAVFTAGAFSFVSAFKRASAHFYFSESLATLADLIEASAGVNFNFGLCAAASLMLIIPSALIFIFGGKKIEEGIEPSAAE
ncbi:MAG: carbohydrate ABC transporter permease [Eubacterium sp.]|jgi:ABC-type glycerol-3-phosphate transport system permease component|nr:carbohydrate ABC transporter permease [Eubacterium sp.]